MRFFLLFSIVALSLGGCCACLAEGADEREVFIFKGGSPAQDGITLGSWGSGKAVEDRERVYTGSHSVKITSGGFYAGGRMDFAQPVALFSGPVDKSRYALFTFFFTEVTSVNPAGTSSYSFDVEAYSTPKASKMRFVFYSDRGDRVSIEQPMRRLDPDDSWVRIGVPVAKLKLPEGVSEFRLKRLCVFTDVPSTFYLGEIKMMTESTPIRTEPMAFQSVVEVNEEAFFMSEADGGISPLNYSWDFDQSNGIQNEYSGQVARFVYTRGGDFTATCTITDLDGIKEPATVTGVFFVSD